MVGWRIGHIGSSLLFMVLETPIKRDEGGGAEGIVGVRNADFRHKVKQCGLGLP